MVLTIPRTLDGIAYLSVASFISIMGTSLRLAVVVTLLIYTLAAAILITMIGVGVAGHTGTVTVTADLTFANAFLAVTDIVSRTQRFLMCIACVLTRTLDLCVCRPCRFHHFHFGNERPQGTCSFYALFQLRCLYIELLGLRQSSVRSPDQRHDPVPRLWYRGLRLRWGHRDLASPRKHRRDAAQNRVRYRSTYHHDSWCYKWSCLR